MKEKKLIFHGSVEEFEVWFSAIKNNFEGNIKGVIEDEN